MKKSILILSALFFLAPLWAQKATLKDLQGKWKLIIYNVQGASLNVVTGKAVVTDNTGPLMAAMSGKLISDMEMYTEGLRMSTLEIEGNNFSQVIVDFMRNGPFTIIEKDGRQFISGKFDDGTTDEIPFKIVDGNLYLSSLKGPKEYIYRKL